MWRTLVSDNRQRRISVFAPSGSAETDQKRPGRNDTRGRTEFKTKGRSSGQECRLQIYFTSWTCSRDSLYVPNFLATGFSVG